MPTENLGDLKTDGIDVSLGWRGSPGAYGRCGFTFDGTYIMKYKYQREQGGEFFMRPAGIRTTRRYSAGSMSMALNWSAGPWSAVFANRYKDGYTDQGGASEVRAYSVFDASVTWTGVAKA